MAKTSIIAPTVPSYLPGGRAQGDLFSAGTVAGGTMLVSAHAGVLTDVVGGDGVAHDMHAQTRLAFERLRITLEAGGFEFGDIAKVRFFIRRPEDYLALNDVRIPYYKSHFKNGNFPASSGFVTEPFIAEQSVIEIEAFASRGKVGYDSPNVLPRIPMELKDQPPFRAGVVAEGVAFTTGQGGFDREARLAGADVASQTIQALENTRHIVEAGGFRVDEIAKLNFYISPTADHDEYLAARNQVMGNWFRQGELPAITSVTTRFPIPRMDVEVEAIAGSGRKIAIDAEPRLESIHSERAASSLRAGKWFFASVNGVDARGVGPPADEETQLRLAIRRTGRLLELAGGSPADVMHATVWLSTQRLYSIFADVALSEWWGQLGASERPACTFVVGEPTSEDSIVEIEVVAVLDESDRARID